MQVLEAVNLAPGTKFDITAQGYAKSERKIIDGFVYIGTQVKNETTGECPNDILIPQTETGFGAVHFIIQYRREAKNYFIKDNGLGTGTWVKIEKPIVLLSDYIVSFADSSMVVHLGLEGSIEILFLDGPKADKKLYVVH